MRRMARRLGASHMRIAGAVGGVVACVGAGAAVAASPKPGGAPLTPPVDTAVAVDRSTPTPRASPTPCPVNVPGAAQTPVDPSLVPVLQQLRAATTAAARQAILRGLTADQRQQVTALMRRAPAAPAPAAACGGAQPEPMIQPDVVSAAPSTAPITNSYVS
ncbi:MAG TPA: hypothetical protein VN193_15430 [Candidatus Angelobacter sp.]|jgi:pyruvate dehydrogenase E2 component (dihydrolipoamide acetyltransferase)|nr:hypothetical protein [Candidatus Angelobacter sp.]